MAAPLLEFLFQVLSYQRLIKRSIDYSHWLRNNAVYDEVRLGTARVKYIVFVLVVGTMSLKFRLHVTICIAFVQSRAK
jgi:hypothetical protein